MKQTLFRRLVLAAFVLGLVVIFMGAWVRLSDAGLGCPDWPGCYGQLTWPTSADEVRDANRAFPGRPVEPEKAWREMVHRYAAGLLGLLILGQAVLAWRMRRSGRPWRLSLFLVALVVFQAVLGMWTVTWQLKPLAVMGHLLGCFATAALLLWLWLRSGTARDTRRPGANRGLRRLALAALCVLVLQVALGGWTSANYAALACPDFPTCQGRWWPRTDFAEAFVMWRGLGTDYEHGVLDAPARTAIQMSHRLGAALTALVLGVLGFRLLAARRPLEGGVLLALLAVQLALGIGNVLMRLPMPVAVGHNAVAALLVMWLVFLLHRSLPRAATESE